MKRFYIGWVSWNKFKGISEGGLVDGDNKLKSFPVYPLSFDTKEEAEEGLRRLEKQLRRDEDVALKMDAGLQSLFSFQAEKFGCHFARKIRRQKVIKFDKLKRGEHKIVKCLSCGRKTMIVRRTYTDRIIKICGCGFEEYQLYGHRILGGERSGNEDD